MWLWVVVLGRESASRSGDWEAESESLCRATTTAYMHAYIYRQTDRHPTFRALIVMMIVMVGLADRAARAKEVGGRLKWGVGKLIARAPVRPTVIPIYHVGR